MTASIARNSLADQAAEAIIELIEARQLKDGDALPGTGELAESLQVSVPVIREAIAGLSAIGLVKRQQGRESTVSTPGMPHMSRLLKLRASGAEVDDEGLQEFREIVEVGNARLAAAQRRAADLEALEDAMQQLRSVSTAEELHAADVAFHAAVARSTHNDLCTLTLDSLEPLLWQLRRRVWSGWVHAGGGLEDIVEAHASVLEAIRTQDPAAAATAMADHLAQARRGLEEPVDPESSPETAHGLPR